MLILAEIMNFLRKVVFSEAELKTAHSVQILDGNCSKVSLRAIGVFFFFFKDYVYELVRMSAGAL